MVFENLPRLVLPMFFKRSGWVRSAFLTVASTLACAATEAPPNEVAEGRYEFEFLTGALWDVGGGATPLDYVVLPQILSLKIPPIGERPWHGGTLLMRSRFSLLLEPITVGPESYYVGVAAAGEIEWHHPNKKFEVFFASGGGVGWMDSKGYEIPGAQGQDFNLNWLIHVGVRYHTSLNWRCSFGVYFQHISNRGMDDINPGLNSLGPTAALSRRF